MNSRKGSSLFVAIGGAELSFGSVSRSEEATVAVGFSPRIWTEVGFVEE